MKSKISKKLNRHLWRVVFIYAAVGFGWIFFSDKLAETLFTHDQLVQIQFYKGIFFVLATSTLLFIIIQRKNSSLKDLFINVRQNMKNFRDTFDQTAVGIAHVTLDGEWIRVNQKLCEILGYKYEDLLKVNVHSLTHPDDVGKTETLERQIRSSEIKDYVLEKRYITKSGNPIYVRLTKSAIKAQNGSIKYLSSIIEDITKQKEAEQELKQSLNEKEKLLAEIHHRVKNNLAVISGLLELQTFNTADETVRKILRESLMRIKSMALVHESYFKSGTLTEVSLGAYLTEFCDYVQESFAETKSEVTLEYDAEPIILNINQAVTCGLLLSEILVNSYVHAFPNQRSGRIYIELTEDAKNVSLKLQDNGIGLPDYIQMQNPSTLGITIINTLVRQLNGTLTVDNSAGTTFEIKFQKEDVKGSSSNLTKDSLFHSS